MSEPRPVPPAGWYPVPESGRLRWWDGTTWGPMAPDSSGSGGRSLAIITHLGMLAGGVIIPLIVYLTEGKGDEYVRHHASESLNFQITFMAFWFGSFLLFFGTAVVGASTDSPPWPVFFLFPLMFIAMFVAIGLSIYGAVQASRGVRWRYPLTVRLVGRG